MAKRGRKLEHGLDLHLRASPELLRQLDELRGDRTRSEVIRELIRGAWESRTDQEG